MIKNVTLVPSRIGCPSLPGTMKGMIMSMPGVQDVVVHYEERSLDITYDDEKVKPEDIIKKIGSELGLSMEIGDTTQSGDSKNKPSAADTCPM